MKRIRVVILLSFVLLSKSLFATVQRSDILIVNGDTLRIRRSFPLEQYFEQKGERTFGGVTIRALYSALWRGYVATWKLENDSLFLIHINIIEDNSVGVKDEFGSDRVFAEWVNGNIQGEEVRVHRRRYVFFWWHYYRYEKRFVFENGKVRATLTAAIRANRFEWLRQNQ